MYMHNHRFFTMNNNFSDYLQNHFQICNNNVQMRIVLKQLCRVTLNKIWAF